MNRAARIFAAAVYAFVTTVGMQAANQERRRQDKGDAYGPEAFFDVAKLMQTTLDDIRHEQPG